MAVVKQALLFGDEEAEAEVNVKSQSKAVATAKPTSSFPLAKKANLPETAIAVKSIRRTKPKPNPTTEKSSATTKTRIVRTSRETFRITNGGMSRDVTLWLEKRGKDHWEICGLPLRDRSEAGPYTSQDEAEGDKAGLRRFWEANGRYADWGA